MLHEIVTKGKLIVDCDIQITNPIYNMIIEEITDMKCPRINVTTVDSGNTIMVSYQRVSITFTPKVIMVSYFDNYIMEYADFSSVKKILSDLLR